MRPIYHVMVSGGVSAIFAIWVQSFWAISVCFLSGIFIDLDHHLDYVLFRKKIPFRYRDLIDFLENDHASKLYLILHSHELLLLFWISIFYFSLDPIWFGMALGFTTHIICDEIVNPLRPLAYFLTYRVKHKFSRTMLFKENYFDDISSSKTN